ncbi:MAG: FHA domain-containing protein [Actinomycetota bacterium]|nr:FHA domain-containing protein [Actinomycetota bacterium]
MIDFWLLIAKYIFLAFLYIFIFWALTVIRRDDSGPHEAADAVAGAKIRVIDGRSAPGSYAIDDSVLLGRAPECDIRLDDVAVSARHARISKRGRHWLVEDLDSSNGTFVDGVRVNGSRRVNPGERIKIGRTELTIEES